MNKKWLGVGLLVLLISGFGWFISIILNVVTFGQLRLLSNILGMTAVASVPITIVLAILNRKK